MASRAPNVCAGPFGAFYDFYIERPWLTQALGRLAWGVDSSVLYASMDPIRRAGSGATIVDVPCGGGVAFRALRPDQDVRYVAADLSPEMLARAERRARRRGLEQVEFAVADMTALPFADGEADLLCSYSGLHMLAEPERAVMEFARCLKPGGELVGTAFFADGSRRARWLYEMGARCGHPTPPRREDLLRWLADAGLVEARVGPQPGFAAFGARKPTVSPRSHEVLRCAYSAFNARDVDAVLETMHPDVDWPNAWEGGRVRGHQAVREYWLRQFEAISSEVEPEGFREGPDGAITVDVRQVVRDAGNGELLSESHVRHRFHLADGLIVSMEVAGD